MNWSRAKNWLIVLFIVVNLFLIYTIISTDIQSSTIDKETISDVVDILKAVSYTHLDVYKRQKLDKSVLGTITARQSCLLCGSSRNYLK